MSKSRNHKELKDAGNQKKFQNPHGLFFKKTLEDPEKAVETLRGMLSPELFSILNLHTLNKEDTSYIDQKLKQFFSDVVYSCYAIDDTPLKIAFLFEHKSYPPDYPHLQLLRYMLEIWDRQAREMQSLSLVLPILIYHGQEKWEYRSFKTFFGRGIDESFKRFIPLFDFFVVNLQSSTYQQIDLKFHLVSLRIAFRLMKSARDKDLIDKLQDVFSDLPELIKDESGRKYFETIIVYLYHVVKRDLNKVMENMYHISQEASEYADSIAMQLIRQGREEALKKAESEKKSSIQKMLKAGVEKKMIAEFLGLNIEKLNAYMKEIEEENENSLKKKE